MDCFRLRFRRESEQSPCYEVVMHFSEKDELTDLVKLTRAFFDENE
jgi:hypothetical protein